MSRLTIGESLAQRLFVAESAVDRALTDAATLAAALPGARAEAALAATTGQPAFEQVAASIAALAQARGHLVDAHRSLGALARRLGLDVLAAGPLDKPGDRPPVGDDRPAGILAERLMNPDQTG